MAFRVQGFGFRVQGSRVQGFGLRGGDDFQGFREFSGVRSWVTGCWDPGPACDALGPLILQLYRFL